MRKVLYIILAAVVLQSCKKKSNRWEFDYQIELDHVKPIGVAILNDTLWISDAEGNRIVQITEIGEILKEEKGFERPMHISSFKNGLAIPEYGKDVITYFENDISKVLESPILDAPSGVDFYKGTFGVADFYHHKVHFNNGSTWMSFGEKGKGNGQFHYPTDIHIDDALLYVADAYNHRIQVFDKQGTFIKLMAEDLGINAATGIFSKDKNVFVTDFENHRVLVLGRSGEQQQVLTEYLSNPVDVIVFKKKLYVLNFKSGTISVFKH